MGPAGCRRAASDSPAGTFELTQVLTAPGELAPAASLGGRCQPAPTGGRLPPDPPPPPPVVNTMDSNVSHVQTHISGSIALKGPQTRPLITPMDAALGHDESPHLQPLLLLLPGRLLLLMRCLQGGMAGRLVAQASRHWHGTGDPPQAGHLGGAEGGTLGGQRGELWTRAATRRPVG